MEPVPEEIRVGGTPCFICQKPTAYLAPGASHPWCRQVTWNRVGVPTIGDPQVPLTMKLAMRRLGIIGPEVVGLFEVNKTVARRFLLRLCRKGLLYRTNVKRHRIGVGVVRGRPPAWIYRATPQGRQIWGSRS